MSPRNSHIHKHVHTRAHAHMRAPTPAFLRAHRPAGERCSAPPAASWQPEHGGSPGPWGHPARLPCLQGRPSWPLRAAPGPARVTGPTCPAPEVTLCPPPTSPHRWAHALPPAPGEVARAAHPSRLRIPGCADAPGSSRDAAAPCHLHLEAGSEARCGGRGEEPEEHEGTRHPRSRQACDPTGPGAASLRLTSEDGVYHSLPLPSCAALGHDLTFLSLSFLVCHMGLTSASAVRSQGGRGGLIHVKHLEQRLARWSLPLPSGPGSLSLDAQVQAAQCPVCARVCCEMGDADTPPPPGGCVPTSAMCHLSH